MSRTATEARSQATAERISIRVGARRYRPPPGRGLRRQHLRSICYTPQAEITNDHSTSRSYPSVHTLATQIFSVDVNLVPVMKVEVHRQRRRRMYGVYEENVCSRSKSAQEERVMSDYTSLVMRRYTGITLGFRSQGVEQFG